MDGKVCPQRLELQGRATEILRSLIELNRQQIEAVASNDQAKLMALDKRMELVFGDKERCFGALQQHTQEHGC